MSFFLFDLSRFRLKFCFKRHIYARARKREKRETHRDRKSDVTKISIPPERVSGTCNHSGEQGRKWQGKLIAVNQVFPIVGMWRNYFSMPRASPLLNGLPRANGLRLLYNNKSNNKVIPMLYHFLSVDGRQ